MSIVGVIGVLLGLVSLAWFSGYKSNDKLALFAVMATAHVLTAVVYYFYVQTNDADTKLYFFDFYGFRNLDFSLGTIFVVKLVQGLKAEIGGTYLDYFLVFQAIGFWGLMFLVRTLEEVLDALKLGWPSGAYLVLALPGMYFWTSAIGKDAPLFFACAMALWATMAASRRWPWFALAIGIMLLIRPHVALVASASIALALLAGRGVSTVWRVILVTISLGAMIAVARTVQSSLQIDLTSVGSIANYVENQSSTAAAASGSAGGLVELSFPLKLIGLLYRPLFFDAGGVFGLVASVQNLFMIFATWVLAREWRTWRAMFRVSLPMRFATIFLAAMILMLTFMFYNVGLALRQREMFDPALIVIFSAVYFLARQRRLTAQAQAVGLIVSAQSQPSFAG